MTGITERKSAMEEQEGKRENKPVWHSHFWRTLISMTLSFWKAIWSQLRIPAMEWERTRGGENPEALIPKNLILHFKAETSPDRQKFSQFCCVFFFPSTAALTKNLLQHHPPGAVSQWFKSSRARATAVSPALPAPTAALRACSQSHQPRGPQLGSSLSAGPGHPAQTATSTASTPTPFKWCLCLPLKTPVCVPNSFDNFIHLYYLYFTSNYVFYHLLAHLIPEYSAVTCSQVSFQGLPPSVLADS